jgi:cyclic pyranopterin phosphate synthase
MAHLQDAFGRTLEYLRLSVTDRCNFRCAYCLPGGCARGAGRSPLSGDEIERLVRAFAGLGFWKIRLTGGEPTLRQDIVEVVRRAAAVPGVRRLGVTTNGYRLAAIATPLRDAGLASLNVSLDSLDPERFEEVTGCPRMATVVEGIETAVAAGIPSVKINTVLLRGLDGGELDRFLSWTRRLPVTVRFIELMQTADNEAYFRRHHVPVEEIRRALEARGWTVLGRRPEDGPATNFGHPDHAGKAGLISPYAAGFCATCNRLRVSSTGDLKLCLFGDRDIPLRHLLRSDTQRQELMRLIEASVRSKPASHALLQGRCGSTRTLAVIGG